MGSFPFLFCFVNLVVLLFGPRSVCGNAELRALMELKSSLDPTNNILSSWTSDGDPCSGLFLGVACNGHLKVANISLQGKHLSGKISPAVAGLRCLSGLYMHYNSLTGEIPSEISNLTELVDLYLNMNNLSGSIPAAIGNMISLQVLQLSSNQLTGHIPVKMGSLEKLNFLSLQHNQLDGPIPGSLGNLEMLRRLYLSFNRLSGRIPTKLANILQLEALDVQNNSLSGYVPSALKRLNEEFEYKNNQNLCGVGFVALRVCYGLDNMNIPDLNPLGVNASSIAKSNCNGSQCKKPSQIPQLLIVVVITSVAIAVAGIGFFTFFCYRRSRQKIASTSDSSEIPLSNDQAKQFHGRSSSPLVCLEYSNGWNPCVNVFSQEHLNSFNLNLEEIEYATQYFSEVNLLGRSNFSCVYKGILKDGSLVAIKSINMTSCKTDECEFAKGLDLLISLRHENLVRLRGFCCSSGRGECYLVYEYASMGNLSKYLDEKDGRSQILDWDTRIAVINGIAKGIGYLHSSNSNKPAILHQNISVEKILINQQFTPLISGSGLPHLLAKDVVFSTLKFSAAKGYLAPEYINTGRFTEKSDIYAFGVIILLILSGKRKLTNWMLLAAESCSFEDFIDANLVGEFSEGEAAKLAKVALDCTNVLPDHRPTMDEVIQELNQLNI